MDLRGVRRCVGRGFVLHLVAAERRRPRQNRSTSFATWTHPGTAMPRHGRNLCRPNRSRQARWRLRRHPSRPLLRCPASAGGC